MKISLCYSQHQFDKAVDYVLKHNRNFRNNRKEVINIFNKSISLLADAVRSGSQMSFVSMIGAYFLIEDMSVESIDHEGYEIFITITVDPHLGGYAVNKITKEVNVDFEV